MASPVSFKEGAVIYFENDPAGTVYIIQSGRVEIVREIQGGGSRQLGQGEILGLADSLGGTACIGTARATEAISATALDVKELKTMLTNNVEIGLKVITSLCSELREIDDLIVQRMRGGVSSVKGDIAGLRIVAEHFQAKGMIRAARYAFGRYLETNPSDDERLEAGLQLAALCEKDGEIEVALQIYSSLSEEFPNDPRPASASERLKGILESFEGSL